MNWIVRFYLTSIFLCGIYTGKSQEIFHNADSLFLAEEFRQSGLAYEWIVFSTQDSDQKARALLGRTQSLKKLGLYEQASSYIDQINLLELHDSTRAAFMYESLLVNYLSENFHEVQSRFLMSRSSLINTSFFGQARLLQCLSQLESGKWKQMNLAAESFIKEIAPPEKADSLISHFDIIFDTLQAPRLKNPKTARIMSMIIPGSGQIYSGYPGDGLISFSLHALALGSAGLAFTQGLYISGWIGGFGLLQKLYFGGTQRAADLSEQKNRLNKELFIQPVSTYLISISERYN